MALYLAYSPTRLSLPRDLNRENFLCGALSPCLGTSRLL
ncbi:UNVERIFIED_CONTAM: hypothetical protein RKD50_003006 [Streptomyces canus]